MLFPRVHPLRAGELGRQWRLCLAWQQCAAASTTAPQPCTSEASSEGQGPTSRLPADVPSLRDFMRGAAGAGAARSLSAAARGSATRRVFIESYGCQMNVNDSEVVLSVLAGAGYTPTHDEAAADVVLLNTCAIRENAESKVGAASPLCRGLGRCGTLLQGRLAACRTCPCLGSLRPVRGT